MNKETLAKLNKKSVKELKLYRDSLEKYILSLPLESTDKAASQVLLYVLDDTISYLERQG